MEICADGYPSAQYLFKEKIHFLAFGYGFCSDVKPKR